MPRTTYKSCISITYNICWYTKLLNHKLEEQLSSNPALHACGIVENTAYLEHQSITTNIDDIPFTVGKLDTKSIETELHSLSG